MICSAPKPPAYPKVLNSIGDHIRAKRIDQGQQIIELARLLDVAEMTIIYWEMNKGEPRASYMPRVIKYLGYNPEELKATTLADVVKAHRRSLGMSHRQYGPHIGIDPSTIAEIEKGRKVMKRTKRKLLAHIEL